MSELSFTHKELPLRNRAVMTVLDMGLPLTEENVQIACKAIKNADDVFGPFPTEEEKNEVNAELRPIAWLIEKCPDFYFMPSMYTDKIFVEYGNPADVMTCAYYVEVQKRVAIPLVPCEESEASHWIIKQPDGSVRGIFDDESREACEDLGYEITPVKAVRSLECSG